MSSSVVNGVKHELPPDNVVFGHSEAMRSVEAKLERVAATNLPVLIVGESGTGKEILARMIHARSPWQAGPFIKVSCPAIPATLADNELLAYLSGALTGTPPTKFGRPEIPDRGTLFLDEIGGLDSALQAKLMQLLQDAQTCRIVTQDDRTVDVRLICSTNRNLQQETDRGGFRQDLFYRINVLQLEVPPLRDRKQDIPVLANYLLSLHAEKYNAQLRPLSPYLMKLLLEYHWPGNIRELENLIKRYVVLGSDEAITAELLQREQPTAKPDIPFDGSVSLKKLTKQAVRDLERQVILRSLQANNWNRKRVAKALCISYRALLYKIRDAGLSSSRASRRAAAAGADMDRAA